jgi:regulator of cell morphogenesis and NO signaling
MEIRSGQSTGQIAVEVKEAIPVFEKYGIDYYPEGNRSLKNACLAAGAPLEEVESELKKIELVSPEQDTPERDWNKETMASLIHYLVQVHHTKTRLELDHIEKELAGLNEGNKEPAELGVIRTLFLKLDDEFREHLQAEEELVFPYLIRAERAMQRGEQAVKTFQNFNSFSNPIRDILFEHGMMDREFKQIEKLTFLFFQENGGEHFRNLVLAFKELEKDNEKHIRLENNILLKRAVQLGLFV